MNEISRTHHIIVRRTLHHRLLVDREKLSLPSCSTRPDYPDGGRRCSEPGYCQRTPDFPSDCSTLASAFFVSSPAWARKGCPAPRTKAAHSAAKDQCHYRGHPSYYTAERDALEHAQYGQSSGRQQSNGMPDMATAQSQTTFGRDIQTQPRQTIRRKTSRYCRALSQPSRRALVLCVDEKSQIQALDRTQPLLPLRPGIPARQTHDYTRHGTTTLFAALSMLDGKVIGDCMPRHRHQEFIRFLQLINVKTPQDLDLHLIIDNYGTHKHPRVLKWLIRHPRFHLHFTPTSSSWLNMVERWFREITDKRIRRGSFKSVPDLIDAIMQYLENHNQNPRIFIWSASVDTIMTKITKCKEALETLH